jgi:hypothetical protein
MDRRSFLKLSTLFAAAMAIESNPILKTIANSTEHQINKVLLYLIQNKNGQWKVLGTKYVDIAKSKINESKFDINTFRILDIVDNSIANKRKLELWNQYNCSGQKGGILDTIESTRRIKLAPSSINTINYMNSEKRQIDLKNFRSKGGTTVGLIQGNKNKQNGLLNKICIEGGKKVSSNKEQWSITSSNGGKKASIKNIESGQVIQALSKAWETRKKKIVCINTGIVWNSLKECAIDNNLYYPTFKNEMARQYKSGIVINNFRYVL